MLEDSDLQWCGDLYFELNLQTQFLCRQWIRDVCKHMLSCSFERVQEYHGYRIPYEWLQTYTVFKGYRLAGFFAFSCAGGFLVQI